MSIARAWRGEKGDDQKAVDLEWVGDGTVDRIIRPTGANEISSRVIEASPYDDVGDAMRALARGVRRRVTFRRAVVVYCSPSKDCKVLLSELPQVGVPVGLRGTAVAVVVDGRDVVELDDGRSVLARVGEDCEILGWWYRLVDRLRGREFA